MDNKLYIGIQENGSLEAYTLRDDKKQSLVITEPWNNDIVINGQWYIEVNGALKRKEKSLFDKFIGFFK